jgi:hypothetical protein
MSDINQEIDRAINDLKNKSDIIAINTSLLGFGLNHRLIEANSYFDYYTGFFLGKSEGFAEKIKLKLIVIFDFDQIQLEIDLVGETHMNIYKNLKTNDLEGEFIEGFRIKNWQIINYNLELIHESF